MTTTIRPPQHGTRTMTTACLYPDRPASGGHAACEGEWRYSFADDTGKVFYPSGPCSCSHHEEEK